MVAPYLGEYQGKKFQSVGKGEINLSSTKEKEKLDDQRKEETRTYGNLMECLKDHLEEEVKEVRLSNRLTASAVCLVGETNDVSPVMEDLMRRSGQPFSKTKRILELNPKHPMLEKIQGIFAQEPKSRELKAYAQLLYGQAVLSEGSQLSDPAGFSKLVAEMMTKSL